jgi:hypothetical protein
MTNPSAIATIPTNRAIIPFMRKLMGAGSLCIAIEGTLHWMALPVQLRFAQKLLARSFSETASSARPNFTKELARNECICIVACEIRFTRNALSGGVASNR